jgi:hypothetical protein
VVDDAEGLVGALERLKVIVDEGAVDTESAAAVLLECQARASGLTAIFRRLLKLSEGEKDFEKNFRASHRQGILHLQDAPSRLARHRENPWQALGLLRLAAARLHQAWPAGKPDQPPIDENGGQQAERGKPPGQLRKSEKASETKEDQQTDAQPDAEQQMLQVIQAAGDDNLMRILAIARRKNIAVDEKMRLIVEVDCRYLGKDSNSWAKLFGVSAAAIRGCAFWKEIRKHKKSLD